MPNLEKEFKQSVYYRSDEDKRKGVDCVMKKKYLGSTKNVYN